MYEPVKRNREYFNQVPKVEGKVYFVSPTACKCHYDPNNTKKTQSVEEFLKRPTKWFFSFSTRSGTTTYIKHNCYFDNEKKAKKEVEILNKLMYTNTEIEDE